MTAFKTNKRQQFTTGSANGRQEEEDAAHRIAGVQTDLCDELSLSVHVIRGLFELKQHLQVQSSSANERQAICTVENTTEDK